MAYYQVEPWGEYMQDLRAGIVASTIANCHRGKNQPPFKPRDFMPRSKKQRKRDLDEDLKNTLRTLKKK